MTAPSPRSSDSVLVYVHGTNGSGKSTLARAILAAAGGATAITKMPGTQRAHWTTTAVGVVLLGRYGDRACGGVDSIQPYADVVKLAHTLSGRRLFCEGLITPGVETCRQMALSVSSHLFVALDTPTEECVSNVLRRRKVKGNTRPYNPDNLYRKHESALSWATRLHAAGLRVQTLRWPEAYCTSLQMLGLQINPRNLLGA